METFNQIVLLGRLGRDPELRTTPGGKTLCSLSLATDRAVRRGGNWESETTWHRVIAFDHLAELAGQRLRKGDPVAVLGEVRSRRWEDGDGKARVTHSVVAQRLSFLSSGQGQAASGTRS